MIFLKICILSRGGSRLPAKLRKRSLCSGRVVCYTTYAPVARPTPNSRGARLEPFESVIFPASLPAGAEKGEVWEEGRGGGPQNHEKISKTSKNTIF